MINKLKIAALFEGSSLIALVFAGLPVKYMLHNPILVKMIAPVHGMLVLVFFALLFSCFAKGLLNKKLTLIGFIASFIPFGTFIFKARCLKDK